MRLFEGTEWDRPPVCEQCGELEKDCTCPHPPRLLTAPEKQTARLNVEKRKKGKVVTVVQGLPAQENDLPALLGQLKTAGGVVAQRFFITLSGGSGAASFHPSEGHV